jgi:hypothetical protein
MIPSDTACADANLRALSSRAVMQAGAPDRFEQCLENIRRHTSAKTYLRRSGPKGGSTSASVLGTTRELVHNILSLNGLALQDTGYG